MSGDDSTQEKLHPPAGCTGKGLNASSLVAVPPAPTLKPLNSVSPYMSLAPPSCCSSTRAKENAWEWESLGASPLRGTFGFPCSLLSHSEGWNLCWFSWLDVVGVPFPTTGSLGWGVQYGAATPCSAGRISVDEVTLLIPMWVWDQPFLHLHSSYKSWHGFFSIFSVGLYS